MNKCGNLVSDTTLRNNRKGRNVNHRALSVITNSQMKKHYSLQVRKIIDKNFINKKNCYIKLNTFSERFYEQTCAEQHFAILGNIIESVTEQSFKKKIFYQLRQQFSKDTPRLVGKQNQKTLSKN